MGFVTNIRRSGDIKYRKSIQNPIISFLLKLKPLPHLLLFSFKVYTFPSWILLP